MIKKVMVGTFKVGIGNSEDYVNKKTAEITSKMNKYLKSPYYNENKELYYGYYTSCIRELDFINTCREIVWELKRILNKKAKGKNDTDYITFGYTRELNRLLEERSRKWEELHR